jgi:lysophospholipase L1-like esterase
MTTLLCWMTLGLVTSLPGWSGFMPQPPDTMVIVCFGNSTTAPRKGLSKPYPERLADKYLEQHVPVKVFNAGKGGNHTGRTDDNAFHKGPHASERFTTEVLNRHPDRVIVCFGINDAWQDLGEHGPSRISLQDYRSNLLKFQQKLGTQEGKTIFLGPNPLGQKYPGFRMRRLRKYHRVTRRVSVSTRSAWVNTFRLFKKHARSTGTDIDDLLLDGMHPNDAGHLLITEAIWNKLQTGY